MANWPTVVKALTFDVFGTAVDWRGTIIREGERFGAERDVAVDWGRLADAWRAGYPLALDRVRRGNRPWTRLDALHREILDDILPDFGLADLTEAERAHWNRVWHRLDPWPDVVGGLLRLKSRYVVATLSNGPVALLTNMARRAGLSWDCILSAELAGHYKPDREVYATAVRLLDLAPSEVMMVAAHAGDLEGARSAGLRTAFVARPGEWGPGRPADVVDGEAFDIIARDFHDLADQLGA